MVNTSVCTIVREEEAVLARCLDCARQFADELVIVDTGSTDATREIAARYTEHLYDFAWRDDFAAARNFSFSKATKDYIMWLDADDVVDGENIARILDLKETLPPDVDAAMFLYNVAFDQGGRPTFSYYRERLVRRACSFTWQEPVHECLQLSGKIVEVGIAISHGKKERAHSTRNLKIYQAREARGELFSARSLYYYARELRTHGMTERAVECYEAFLRRSDGWPEDRLMALNDLSHCYQAQGRHRDAVNILFRGFAEAPPRPQACCQLAALFKEQGEEDCAIYWYNRATDCPPQTGWGFTMPDYAGYIPHMELCTLYDAKGDLGKAYAHHLLAKAIKPDDPSVQHNTQYFAGIGFPQKLV